MYKLVLCKIVGQTENFYSIINSNNHNLRTPKFAGIDDTSRKPCINTLLRYCYRNDSNYIDRVLNIGYNFKAKQIVVINDIANFNVLIYSDIYQIIYDLFPEELL